MNASTGARNERIDVQVLADFLELTKPRIGTFVLIAAFVGALLAQGPGAATLLALEAAVFVTLVGAGSSVFNHVLEEDLDRLMERTRQRPLAAGRLSKAAAITFGCTLTVVGVVGLATRFNLLTALLALGSLVAYALIYTPLKRATSLNTVIGAIPGAMPPLLGYVAIAGTPETWGWTLFAILFAWQFPHFMAIAWLHREDYRRAGMQMLPALPDAEGLAGRQALAYGLVLFLISLLPVLRGDAGLIYGAGAFVLGIVYTGASAWFAHRETPKRARAVLYASLVYLPLTFSLVLMDPVVHRALG